MEVEGLVRKDGRNEFQMRPFQTELGLLNRADGSARFTQDNSSVLVAVYGPMDVNQRKEKIDRAFVDVIYQPQSGMAGYPEKEKESYIRNALENSILSTLHPRTGINIIVQVLSEDGSILSTAINGAALALLDAGIAMKSMVGSITCAIGQDGTLLIDPTQQEEEDASSIFVFALNSPFDGVVSSKTSGTFSEEEYFACLEAAKKGASRVTGFVRESYQKQYK
eukprot:TRINITY_DN22467_c0_g1_i1.p1 TRINITY_DN22467_c0_g1~~TRINITY_DN22467_c0_g1_i1.p1  ORF type:complete len:223 (+),score=16.46 TRINITY_DN22467_c0_g1_i1:65-733(+)